MTKKEELEIRRQKKIEAEMQRVEMLCEFEKKYSTCSYICGIDEAGRGPLAGPVVAGAVILPKECRIPYINDSKKLSEKRREELFQIIQCEAISIGIGIVDEQRIDEINILQATYEAMRIAVGQLEYVPDILLNDAVRIPGLTMEQLPIIKGDSKSISIAAASIIAKVTRDHLMQAYDSMYPQYGFAKHKGYGTRQHIDAIIENGPCKIHRKTFITKFV